MYLTLEIVGSDAARFGPQRMHTFGIEGGRIGRALDNQWVIPDKYIHGVHAVVRYMSGLFFIEKRGQNRVAVNRPEVDLPQNQPYPLKDGDRLFLDQYELSVRVSRSAPEAKAEVLDPLPLAPSGSSPDLALADTGIREGLQQLDPRDLDPLDHLGGLPPRQQPAPPPPSSLLMHGSVLSDHYRAPEVRANPIAGANFIPDDWERASMTRLDPVVSAARPAAPGNPPRVAASASVPEQPPVAPTVVATSARAPAAGGNPLSASTGCATAPPAAYAGLGQALGIRPNELTAADIELVGGALRGCLAGLIELTQQRAEFRSRLRAAPTRGTRTDPNPLRQAANVEDVLHEFFSRRRPGSLPVDRAVLDGFEEVRLHQQAVTEAMRAAFDALIARLDPAAHAAGTETEARGGVRGFGRARPWDHYVEYFREQLGGNRDEAFQRLFGTEFAAAYDKALERLRTLARHQVAR